MVLPLVLLPALLPAAASAQVHDHAMPALSLDSLTRPISIRSQIGVAHDSAGRLPVAAQRYYDQGLALLHNYVWMDASRSFNEVLRLAPGNALASLGLSYSFDALNLRSLAREQLATAAAAATTPHDRRHVELRQMELRAEDAPNDAALVRTYRSALDAALTEFPADEELWLLRGLAEANVPGDRGQGSAAGSVRYYEQVLRLAPENLAAHHYLAHAFENSGDTARALDAATHYAERAASVPHAHHMVGHDLRRAGRIREAIAQFEQADQLERAYFAAEGIAPETDWHYEHNLDLLGTSYQYAGQLRQASTLLRRAFELPSANLVQIVNKRQWPLMLRLAGRRDEAMTAAIWLASHPNAVVQAIGHIETAHVLLMRGDRVKAATSANAAVALLRTRPAGGGLADIPLRLLQGEFLLRQGEWARADTLLTTAIADARVSQGPDEWAQALFMMEWVATTAREAGDWSLADTIARLMLAHDPSYGGSHFATALVAVHAGDHTRAQIEFLEARRLWAQADPDFAPRLIVDRAIEKKH